MGVSRAEGSRGLVPTSEGQGLNLGVGVHSQAKRRNNKEIWRVMLLFPLPLYWGTGTGDVPTFRLAR